ncbi:hypothetical protein ORI20_06990 [Mycobacterium sp. CVI_P3]|uniref:Carotenoid biosynthesis protein n=1 Tax=Mycobacterium pinniadriaticum TaxID=2994102 RepID=A0ABT3SBP3_9MYCO|nr:hypothetical protein [Mycobacterium pinniadriaticum]MCX2930011.1 hypothetical protein [Mycobacterium pinniadriaticum]MCX2936340.1 hypothetical protein [Mycobacterium pinniadriaticum]
MTLLAGHFDLPPTPDGTVMPHTAQVITTAVMGVLVAAFLVYAICELVHRRSATLILLLIGGAISYLNEPIDDVLGLVWHPEAGQWTAIDTFSRVPLWGLGIYIVFFGGMPYLILQNLRRGMSRAQLWRWVGMLVIIDIAVELPVLASGIYQYFGDAPMQVGGFPVYWIFINAVGPLGLAVLLLAAEDRFTGWRMLYLPLLPMVCNAASSVAVGWPIYSALNAQAGPVVTWGAAFLTIAIGLSVLDILITTAARISVRLREPGLQELLT